VAGLIPAGKLTRRKFDKYGKVNSTTFYKRFTSWGNALAVAGLSNRFDDSKIAFTDEERFENLLTTWTALGRQPLYREMAEPPSLIAVDSYVKRWGSWRKALEAFVDRVNQDAPNETRSVSKTSASKKVSAKRTPRNIPLGLRYTVLNRDRFRCVVDGRSPATHPVTLHVDHIKPWAEGGETVLENLRTLCSDCNLGKGVRDEVINP
jgi:5-methylcytosine-specific restriction endonuclease McrA